MPEKSKVEMLRERMKKLNKGFGKGQKADIAKNANEWMAANKEMKKVSDKDCK